MRLIAKKDAEGGTYIVETSNDGAAVRKKLEGEREEGERISAYLEALCEDNEQGAGRLLDALSRLTEEVERRRKAFAEKKKHTTKRSRAKRPVPSDHH